MKISMVGMVALVSLGSLADDRPYSASAGIAEIAPYTSAVLFNALDVQKKRNGNGWEKTVYDPNGGERLIWCYDPKVGSDHHYVCFIKNAINVD